MAVACDLQFISADLAYHGAMRACLPRDVDHIGYMFGFQADDDARRRFSKEQRRRGADAARFCMLAKIYARADSLSTVAGKTALGKGHRQSALAAIVGRTDNPRPNRFQASFLDGDLDFQIEPRN